MNKFFEDIMPRSVTLITDYSHKSDPSIRFHYIDEDNDKAIVVVSNKCIFVDTDTPSCGVNFSLPVCRYFLCVMEDLQQTLNKVAA